MNLGTMIIRIYPTDYLNTDISDDCLKMEFYPPIQRHTVVRNQDTDTYYLRIHVQRYCIMKNLIYPGYHRRNSL